jgi:hypothetical protein
MAINPAITIALRSDKMDLNHGIQRHVIEPSPRVKAMIGGIDEEIRHIEKQSATRGFNDAP